MTVSPILESYKRKEKSWMNGEINNNNNYDNDKYDDEKSDRIALDIAADKSSTNDHRHPSQRSHKDRRYSCYTGRFVPWASMVSFVVTWSGLFLFSWKMYYGLVDMETIAGGFFKTATDYFQMGREIILLMGIGMATITGCMLIMGFFTTIDTDRGYHGGRSSCVCAILSNRFVTGVFWTLAYLLNIFWLAVLCLLVALTSAYICFLPICLPQAGTVDMLCFNFSMVAAAITGKKSDPEMLSLLLCGGPIDKFCKLTKAIVPWYWGAFGGCLVVLLGLWHFNASLAANYAHSKHTRRYRQIRHRSKRHVKWTRNWRIKSTITATSTNSTTATAAGASASRSYSSKEPTSSSRVSTVSESVALVRKSSESVLLDPRYLHRQHRRQGSDTTTDTFANDTPVSGGLGGGGGFVESSEPNLDTVDREQLLPRSTSTDSIVLQRQATTSNDNSDSFTRNATMPAARRLDRY